MFFECVDDIVSESLQENLFVARVVYDLLFFFIVIIIVLNLIFGVIIDTFADLRSEKQQKDEILKNTCFVCGKKAETHVHVIVSMIDEKNENCWNFIHYDTVIIKVWRINYSFDYIKLEFSLYIFVLLYSRIEPQQFWQQVCVLWWA